MQTVFNLKQLLGLTTFFQSFAADEIERIADRGHIRLFSDAELILQEGDAGNSLFLIIEGSGQVFVQGLNEEELVLARLEAGEVFGEQAFLRDGPKARTASVRSIGTLQAFEITYAQLVDCLNSDNDLRQQIERRGTEFQRNRRNRLQEAVYQFINPGDCDLDSRVETYDAGQEIFAEGDPGDRVYLLLSGSLHVTRNGKDEKTQILLVPGNLFGELAVMQQEPRSATVTSLARSEVLSFNGDYFLKASARNPALQSMMQMLAHCYHSGHNGVVVRHSGHLNGEPCLTTTFLLDDRRRIIATRIQGAQTFCAVVSGDLPENAQHFEYQSSDGPVRREITAAAGRICRLYSEGDWGSLGIAFRKLLDGADIRLWQLELFRETGELEQQQTTSLTEDTDTICACMSVTRGALRTVITEGCLTVDGIAEKTGATTVCGGCIPAVNEMLGRSDWTPASLISVIPLTPDIHAFRFQPRHGECLPFLPGQHIVVQGKIANRWVQRSYTLSSASSNQSWYEITVKREPRGLFSRWLFEKHSPSELFRISRPSGNFFLPDDQQNDVVCLMGGIGITPAISMCRSLEGKTRDYRLHLDYSVSSPREQIATEEFARVAAGDSLFSWRVRFTRTEGRITQSEVSDLVAMHPEATWFLCAGEAYLQTVSGYLRQAGVAEQQIRMEIFTPAVTKKAQRFAGAGAEDAGSGRPGVNARPAALTSEQEAEQYLSQFFEETGKTDRFPDRWREVQQEFQQVGTYTHTLEELSFAARLSWRNSIRCVGRLHWQGLKVRDFRHVTTEDEMFDAIFEHIEMATNKGEIQAVMTVFPPEKKLQARVWSPQLFRYAGYTNSDGTILGDPANVDLTRVALTLGWKPPATRTRFDLLPVIVQIAGRRPVFREIPSELILEVPLQHPDFAWFAELGLKWYALPAVSEMKMDAGGIVYPAIPFNGWYQGTEIGARNLSDTGRYNMLPVIARKMGLDTQNDRSLWKDRALVELNVAVLFSFETHKVKLVDHHYSTRTFEEFEENEKKAGRPVHAKWHWIVPPISASTTNAYLQGNKWQPIEFKPNFYRQPIPWEQDLSWQNDPVSEST